MQPATILQLIAGIAGTWFGAELLVRGSARLALGFGVRPLVVGLTVVALGTSSPEAVVSFVAAGKGSAGIALGNVFGSNIANIGLILGFVCMLHPMRVNWKEIEPDLYWMIAATALAAAAAYAGMLNRPVGLLLLTILILSVVLTVRRSRKRTAAEAENAVDLPDGVAVPASMDRKTLVTAVVQSVVGLVVLIIGANALVGAAESMARAWGVPEEIIGATMVAVGTSLPELAASVVAVVRGHHDIGIGNIIGSNHMNLLFVLGGVCTISEVQAPDSVLHTVIPVAIAFTLVLVPMLATGGRVGRREGALLLAGYVAFSFSAYFR